MQLAPQLCLVAPAKVKATLLTEVGGEVDLTGDAGTIGRRKLFLLFAMYILYYIILYHNCKKDEMVYTD